MRDIEHTMALGQRIVETKRLVENWCAHASVKRWEGSGVGLIEQMTGLPIGHHYIQCPYAKAHGMASMHLEEVALEFYDKNCATCQAREPVRLPNISEIVGKRDEAQRARVEEEARRAEEAAREIAERQRHRESLRPDLPAAERDLLDLLAAVDAGEDEDAGAQLTEAARAAPERFNEVLVEQLHVLLGAGGARRAEVALECLALVL